MIREYIFVDVETTGLDAQTDKLVELTYAYRADYDYVFETLYFGVTEVPVFIDNLIGFTERGIAGKESPHEAIQAFLTVTEGHTMVSANPPFDAGFLKVNGLNRFHHRNLDIESYAAAKLDLNYVPGMQDIYDILNDRGYKLTAPNHTSLADVQSMVDAYEILSML